MMMTAKRTFGRGGRRGRKHHRAAIGACRRAAQQARIVHGPYCWPQTIHTHMTRAERAHKALGLDWLCSSNAGGLLR